MSGAEREQGKLADQDQARVFYLFAYHVLKLKQLLRCSICVDVFENPVAASTCIHVFCEDCIRTYLEYSSAGEPPCPICQVPILQDSLHSHDFLSSVAKFVTNSLGQIDMVLGSSTNELPPLQSVVKLAKDNGAVKEMFTKRNDPMKNPLPPPDISAILKARKVLVGPNNKIISSKEDSPFLYSVTASANKDDGFKSNAQGSATIDNKVKPLSEVVKDPFDVLKQTPVQNPLFRNRRNLNTKMYNNRKGINQSNNEKSTRYVDKVHEFENKANKNDIIQWLHDSRNKFHLIPQLQEKDMSNVQVLDFDMPSVSQMHTSKCRAAPPLSQINRQKVEQNRIRQKNDQIIRLSRSDFPKNKCLTQANKRTRSLECCVKKIAPTLKLKRHSIAVYESPEEKVNIEQINSEEDVIFTGAYKIATEKNVIVDLIEEQYLNTIENEMQKSKPTTSAKFTRKASKLLESPKRSKRISSKLLQTIEETNKRLKSSMDTSSGWTRMKEIKKTIRKTEKKPGKLTVVSRHSSLDNLTDTAVKIADKNNQNSVAKSGKGKQKTVAKNAEPVVLINRMDIDNMVGTKNVTERHVFDLEDVESYFSKNLNKLVAEESSSRNKSKKDTPKEVEQAKIGSPVTKNKLPKSCTNSENKKDKLAIQILKERNVSAPISVSNKNDISEKKNDKSKASCNRVLERQKRLLASSLANNVCSDTKKLENNSNKIAEGRSLSVSNLNDNETIKNDTSRKSKNVTQTEKQSTTIHVKIENFCKKSKNSSNQDEKRNKPEPSTNDITANDDMSSKVGNKSRNNLRDVKIKSKLSVSSQLANEVEMEISELKENCLKSSDVLVSKEPQLMSALRNGIQEGKSKLINLSNRSTKEHKLEPAESSPNKSNRLMSSVNQAVEIKSSKRKSTDSKQHQNDDDFAKPSEVIDATNFNDTKDIDNDIFNTPTQIIIIPDSEQTEREPQNKEFKAVLKQKIWLLNDVLNTIDDKHDAKRVFNMVSSMKTILVDIERTLTNFSNSGENNTDESHLKSNHQLSRSLELMHSVYVQTDNLNEMSSLFSHSITTQTDLPRPVHKHAAIQTDSHDSSRGFRISSTDMFNLQPVVQAQTQTDPMMCPKCNYTFLNTTNSAENKNVLDANSANTTKTLSVKCSLSASFDNIDFETQDIIKGKQIDITASSVKNSRNTQKCGGSKIVDKAIQNKTISENNLKELKTLKGPSVSEKSQQADVVAQTCAKEDIKKTFKRIRKPSSDSDSDRDVLPKDVKRNKYIQEDTISLQFVSQPMNERSQPNGNVTQGDGFALSEGSQDINYADYLEKILKNCDDDQKVMLPPKPVKERPLEPPVKRFKTQDIIKECEMIIKEACSSTISIENTENYSNKFNSSRSQNVPETTKLTLAALENEFQHDFSGDVKSTEAKAVSKSAAINLDDSHEMELAPCTKNQNKDMNKSKAAKDKFSESLFISADNFGNNVRTHGSIQDNSGKNQSVEVVQMHSKQINTGEKKVTKQCLDELINQFNNLDDSFEDDINAEVESINESTVQNSSNVDNNIHNKSKNYGSDKIKILQDIVLNKSDIIRNQGDNPVNINVPKENKAGPIVDFDVSLEDNASTKSDEMFESDVEVVETTPQKNKPAVLETLSFLSQAYYNPNEKMILPPLVDESPDVISSCDPPPLSCLNKTFTPPPEFQDFLNPGNGNDDEIIIIESGKSEKIDQIPSESEKNIPLSSLTPDLLLPQTSQVNDQYNKKEHFVTSTPCTQGSQIMSVRTLNMSPIHAKESNSRLNPILAAQTSKFSPLIIVKSKTPPPQKMQPLTTSTPKQKSILSYVRPTENLNASSDRRSQSSQKSAHNLSLLNQKPCVACTRMNKEQLLAITALSSKQLIRYSNSFSATVTHMVVAANEHQWVKDHTMKFVSAVAAGIWVVSFSWIEECLKQGRILPEEPFEALDVSGVAGPRQSRLTKITNPLLQGYVIHAAPPFLSTTQKEVENVILLLGGEVVPRPDDLLSSNGKVRLIITEAKGTQDFELYEMWLETLKVVTVDLEWLSRSVGQYQKLSVRPFTLCSDDSLCDLGYPSELIVEVPYSVSSHNTLSVI